MRRLRLIWVEGAIVEQVEDTVSRGEAGDFCTGFADLHYAGGTLYLFTLMEQPKFTQSSGPVPRPYLIAYQDGQKGVFLRDPIRPARGFAM